MISHLLLEAGPGTHPTVTVCQGSVTINLVLLQGTVNYCQFNVDTLISSLLAMVLTLVIGFAIAYRLQHGTPGKLQLLFEFFIGYVRQTTGETVGPDAGFVVPLAATIGFFILVANWIEFFPLAAPLRAANSDWNLTLAMALVVFFVVEWYSIKVLGFGGFAKRFTKPYTILLPLTIIEEAVKPITLSLRLFGNIFAGGLMVFLLGSLFSYGISALGTANIWAGVGLVGLILWKTFDVFFIGTIQAFIFMLLTIIYFGMARGEGH